MESTNNSHLMPIIKMNINKIHNDWYHKKIWWRWGLQIFKNPTGRWQKMCGHEKTRTEYSIRIRSILRPELIVLNRIITINSLAISAVTYSFNPINWTLAEMKKMDSKLWKLLICHNMHHPKADVKRFCFKFNLI